MMRKFNSRYPQQTRGKPAQNGPQNTAKSRNNAKQQNERYLTQARDALSLGDRVLAEKYFQYADHYFRIMAVSEAPGASGTPHGNGQSNGASQERSGQEKSVQERSGRHNNAHSHNGHPKTDQNAQRHGQRDGSQNISASQSGAQLSDNPVEIDLSDGVLSPGDEMPKKSAVNRSRRRKPPVDKGIQQAPLNLEASPEAPREATTVQRSTSADDAVKHDAMKMEPIQGGARAEAKPNNAPKPVRKSAAAKADPAAVSSSDAVPAPAAVAPETSDVGKSEIGKLKLKPALRGRPAGAVSTKAASVKKTPVASDVDA